MEAQTIKQGLSEADRLYKEQMEKSRFIKEANLLTEEEQLWLEVGVDIFFVDRPSTWLREIEETMDTLVSLNGSSSEYRDAETISRIYHMLKCMRDAFKRMQQLDAKPY